MTASGCCGVLTTNHTNLTNEEEWDGQVCCVRPLDRIFNEVVYYTAAFQGPTAPESLREALGQVAAEHRKRPFDCVAFIRGGGSVTELSCLNDYRLAADVCRFGVPVLS